MSNMANLVVKLTTDNRGLQRGFKGAQSTVSSFASNALKVAAPIGAALAAAFGGKAILDAAKVQQQAEKKLEGVLAATGNAAGLTADEIKAYAGELQSLTGIGDELTIDAAGVLGTFTKVQGDQFKRALALGQDLAAVFGGDMQGKVLQLGKALNDPIKGMSALAESGVSFSAEQQKQIRAYQEQGNLVAAQQVILDEVANQVGGVAGNMKDPIEALKGTLGDIAESLGFLILPTIHEVANAFNEWIGGVVPAQDSFKQLGEDIAFTFRNFGSLAKVALIDVVLTALDYFPMMEKPIENVAAFFTGTFAGMKAFFGAFVQNVISGFQEIGNVAKAIAAGASAAFEAIASGDFTGAAGAFADAFMSELASQQDAKSGGNPFTAYAEAFKQASDDTRKMFTEKGGLGGLLRDEKQKLLDSIAQDELKREQQQAQAKQNAETPAGTTGLTPKSSATSSGPVDAIEVGSDRAFDMIVRAMSGGKGTPEQEVAKNTATMVQQQENMILELKQLKGNKLPVLGAA